MAIRFGPAGLGPVKTAEKVLESYHKLGLRACEIAFTYGIYIKDDEIAKNIGKKARELGIDLSIHAPYYINLNSDDEHKIVASKRRIIDCCRIGELLGVKTVVFHPGFYGKLGKEESYDNIKREILKIMNEIKKNGWKVQIAPETTGKVNVFGSVEEISRLKDETGCGFCIDFAHILAREKNVDYAKIKRLFPEKEWHCHFSGIVYGCKGEKHHKETEEEEWKRLLEEINDGREIKIINESPRMVEDSAKGLDIYKEKSKDKYL